MAIKFRKVCIIGVGLLGGSLGMALKKRRLAGEVCGFGRDAARLALARRLKALDSSSRDLGQAARGADLVVLATPVPRFTEFLGKLALAAPLACVVTDVGSVKGAWVREWEEAAAPLAFVPSHPMAGSEKTGVEAARPDLFEGAPCVCTPTARTPRPALARVESLWRSLGCRLVRLSPGEHDRRLGLLSHLPHAAAFALVRAIDSLDPMDWSLAGKGFRDTTRVAASDPELWAGIFLANRGVLKRGLKSLRRELDRLAALLDAPGTRGLAGYLEKASSLRRRL